MPFISRAALLFAPVLFLAVPSLRAQCTDGVTGNGVPIANGDSTPSVGDGTNFGLLNCGPATHNFTFTKSDSVTGPHIATVTVNPPNGAFSVQPVNHDNFPSCTPQAFNVIFTPTSTALETAVITVTVESFPIIIFAPPPPGKAAAPGGHNKLVSMSWSFTVQGAGQPYSVQTGTRTVLLNGDNSPTTVKGTDYGPVSVNGGFSPKRFLLVNACSTPINITSIRAVTGPGSGIDSPDFVLRQPIPTSIPASTGSAPGAAFLDIAFDPSQLGLRTAAIEIDTDSFTQPRFIFAVAGTGTEGLVAIGNGNAIPNGDATPAGIDGTDFGNVGFACDSVIRTFTIRNDGGVDTTITQVSTDPATEFTINPAFVPAGLAPGDSTSFQVLFNPTSRGAFSANVIIDGRTANSLENYSFIVQGTGADVIDVVGKSGAVIANGDVSPSSAESTDFGSAALGCGVIDNLYTIRNSSAADLTITNVSATGDFTAISDLLFTIPAGGTGSFIIRFDPTVRGLRSGSVSIDCAESQAAGQPLYSFAVQGSGGVGDPETAVDLTGAWDFVSSKTLTNRVRARFRVFSGGNARVPVDYYLSEDHLTCDAAAALRGKLTPVTADQIADIYVGTCTTRRGISRIRTPVRSGFYLLAVIDPANTVIESNEDNNVVVFEGSPAFW